MLSSSSPKPTSTVSRPRVRLKSATIGIEAPDPISTVSLPHSSVSARLAAASGFMFQSSAIAGVAADDAVDVAGRPRRDLLDQQAALLAGRKRKPDRLEKRIRRQVELG